LAAVVEMVDIMCLAAMAEIVVIMYLAATLGVVAIMDLAAMAEVEVAAVLVVEVEVEGVDASSLRCQIEPYSLTPSKCCHMLQHPSSPFSKFLISMFAMPKPHAHSAPSPVRQADSQTAPA
jgi:hypothetical protein